MESYRIFAKKADEIIRRYDRKPAATYMMSDGTKKVTSFRGIGNFIKAAQRFFRRNNLREGDRAALLMPTAPWTFMVALSLMYSGITVVPVDPSLPVDEIERIIIFSDVRAVFTDRELFGKLGKRITEEIPCFSQGADSPAVPLSGKKFSLPPTPDPETDVATIIFSSGTTGQMKGIKVPFRSVIRAKKIVREDVGLNDKMKYLLVLPFNHIAGFTSAMTFFLMGCEIGFIENVDSSKLQSGLVNFQPDCFVIVPRVYEVMQQKINAAIHEKGKAAEILINLLFKMSAYSRKNFGVNIGKFLFRGLRNQVFGRNITNLGTGASPCKPETAEFFLNLGVYWHNFYATTETNVPIVVTKFTDRYPSDTVGNVNNHSGINIRIIDPDSNGIGEISVKSELIMKGYFREPELTEKSFRDGYFRTGDYGYIDDSGFLHITGRIKESIVLRNGKKVSPSDVDDYYSARAEGFEIASRGILNEREQCDEIHLFIEENGTTDRGATVRLFEDISRKAPSMYKLSGIHFVKSIPKTSVGKVKRFCLVPCDSDGQSSTEIIADSENIYEAVCSAIRSLLSLGDDSEIKGSMSLSKDLGMESLDIFELCVRLDEIYNISLESELHERMTVDEIVAIAGKGKGTSRKNDAAKFPLKRTERDYRNLRIFTKISRLLWNMEVRGLEKIDPDKNYIFCPNHESHFDGMWIIGSFDERISHNVCSVAADYLFRDRIFRKGIRIMGGIPVHRTGNTTTAMTRALECITEENYNLLIHPEGTRTRDGKLGKFKNGAAELSVKSGVSIVPVCISGAREVFPPENNLPHFFDFRKMKKYRIIITFGDPISPDGLTSEEITERIRRQIVGIKKTDRRSCNNGKHS